MANALAFIGGGLLQGVGKGLVESGKEKRERALADLQHRRNLERDENKLEGRRGLLDERLRVEQKLAEERETGAETRLELNLESRERLATEASKERRGLASEATESREGVRS